MATNRARKLNPHLEKLREDILEPPDINNIVKKLITIPKIHAAFLYSQDGYVLLQKLCLWLSSTKPSYHYSGWEDFGIKLGLDPLLIRNIKYNLQHEDPTSYVLLAYTQKEDATLEDILYALQEIKRHDILFEMQDLVRNFSDVILVKHNTNEHTHIIKPKFLPNCPFIFKNLNKSEEKNIEPKIITEVVQKSIPLTSEKKSNQTPYTKTVLLTYSSDATDIIQKCLPHFRKPRNDLKLGVVVLNEHRHKLNINPEQFIFECFAQVDYVFPIITTQYLQHITNSALNNDSAVVNADHKYVKYIYTLMNTHYIKNGCKNTKVRCFIPDDVIHTILKHSVMSHSLFQVWTAISEMDTLIDGILKSNI